MSTTIDEKGLYGSSTIGVEPSTSSDEEAAEGTCIDVTAGSQALHRSLRGPEVQLFAIGGAIGTCEA